MLVEGPPGIGKTALCMQLADAARSAGGVALWGRCLEEPGAPAYWPWRQLVRSLADAMNPGGLLGLTNAAMQAQNEPGPREAAPPPLAQPASRSVARAERKRR